MKKLSAINRSIDILSSVILLIFFAFCLDLFFFSSLRAIGPVFYIVCIGIKIGLYAGIYGSIVELVSEEELVLSKRKFKANIKQFWKPYLVLTLLSLIAHQWYINYFSNLTIDLFNPEFVVLAVMAMLVVHQKYLKNSPTPKRKVRIGLKDFLLVASLYLLDLFIKAMGVFIPYDIMAVANIGVFLSICIHFLTFTFLTTLILDHYPEINQGFDNEHKLYLINPLSGGIMTGTFSAFIRLYPPVFAILKALSPKKYKKTREFNRFAWHKRFYKPNKLIAITSYTSNIAESYKIAKEFRKAGSKVIMGGPHVTYHPDEALDFCDSVVIGECESVWKQVVEDYENNSLKPKYFGEALDDFSSEVHKELLTYPPEIIKDCIEVTRGCKFRCDFCTIPSLSGGKTRQRPIHEIIELIEKVKPYYKRVNLIDNNIYSNPAYAKELFTALKPLNIEWISACTIDIVKNEETLKLARESGCREFLFGYEIFGGSLETKQRGKFALADKYCVFTNKIKKMGISIKGTFILGFDSDNIKNIFNLWRFCFQIYPYFTNLSILTPLPGSRLYHQMLEENRTINLNWREYDCHKLVFRQGTLNGLLMQKILPQIKYLFLLTTSSFGHTMLLIIAICLFMSIKTF